MKKAIILCGPSGAGKTHARTVGEYKHLPYIDIADYYKMGFKDWTAAVGMVIKKSLEMLNVHDEIVIEGYFLPGSPSRFALDHALKSHDIVTEFVHFKTELKICAQRLKSDLDSGKISSEDYNSRMKLLRWAFKR